MKFLLILAIMDGEMVIDTNLTDTDCLFNLSEVQVILEDVMPPEEFELWCELDTYEVE